ncbi:MAG: cupin domain-containing protein [Alphaproteobacteria bacterium]|nr:cupin domain-containing protein [Alphaproteobacteria bacterium]MBU0795442.1 cupin domain-containing protein [Alphaproteobacteria bacterium]MBU0876603.1 cupin domain-containing protein [Alphaproteobacteria bacterium]MBU1769304.1 cupin domain-containing protein [Alphaproteobacteria bacterium]
MSYPFALLSRATDLRAFRIAPGDSNYFVILFDPETPGYEPICVIEIFEPGGRTPPNSHVSAHEFFYVLHGHGKALCDGEALPLRQGDALLLRPGAEHIIENLGETKLYTLTVMTPNEGFAELIRAGLPVELDDEDRAVLAGTIA